MPRLRLAGIVLLLSAVPGLAQPPLINPRGIINAFTLQPAPSRVAPGGLILIQGINLGPGDTARSEKLPWATELSGVEVRVANRPAALYSVSATLIVAQVPWQTQNGLVPVVVRRGGQDSRPALVQVQPTVISIKTRNEAGYGEAGVASGQRVSLTVSGLGLTEEAVENGAAAGEGATVAPRVAARAIVNGTPVETTVRLSSSKPGEFEVTADLPEGTRPGDVITISNGGQIPGNRAVFGRLSEPAMQFLRLPAGAAAIRTLRNGDLRGDYVVASAPRGQDGCYPSWIFDFSRNQAARIEGCLYGPQANQPSPVQPLNESGLLASLAGPGDGTAQTGFTNKVTVFNPAKAEPMTVELPSKVSAVAGGPNGAVIAVAPGPPPAAYQINPMTGEVTEGLGGGAAVPGGGAGGAGGAFQLNPLVSLDLGDGIKEQLTAAQNVGQGTRVALYGDSATQPAKAKLALINADGGLMETRDVPDGWLPLIPPAPPQGVGGPGGGGGGQPGGGGPGIIIGGPGGLAFRVIANYDNGRRSYAVLMRRSDKSRDGFVTFSGPGLEAGVSEFPEGWFAATCSAQVQVFNLELSGRVALFGARRAEEAIRNPCLASGYLIYDLATRGASTVALTGIGQANVQAPRGDVNDYLFAANTDAANAALSDTLHVLDSVTNTAFRLDLPAGVAGFANVVPVPAMSGLLAVATNRVAGDGGLVFFDLEKEQSLVLSVPEGFQNIQPVGVFPNTRKVVARGINADATASQFLVYDLMNQGDLKVIPNPEGVAFVGPLPAAAAPGGGGGGPGPGGPGQPPGGGGAGGGAQQPQVPQQPLAVSDKANAIAAIAWNANRQPVGVVTVRVP